MGQSTICQCAIHNPVGSGYGGPEAGANSVLCYSCQRQYDCVTRTRERDAQEDLPEVEVASEC